MKKWHYLIALSAVLAISGVLTTPAQASEPRLPEQNVATITDAQEDFCYKQSQVAIVLVTYRDRGISKVDMVHLMKKALGAEEDRATLDLTIQLAASVYDTPDATAEEFEEATYAVCSRNMAKEGWPKKK